MIFTLKVSFYRIIYLEIIWSIFELKLLTAKIFLHSFMCSSDIDPLCLDLSIFKDEKIRSKWWVLPKIVIAFHEFGLIGSKFWWKLINYNIHKFFTSYGLRLWEPDLAYESQFFKAWYSVSHKSVHWVKIFHYWKRVLYLKCKLETETFNSYFLIISQTS
jgi:hypothetical protein